MLKLTGWKVKDFHALMWILWLSNNNWGNDKQVKVLIPLQLSIPMTLPIFCIKDYNVTNQSIREPLANWMHDTADPMIFAITKPPILMLLIQWIIEFLWNTLSTVMIYILIQKKKKKKKKIHCIRIFRSIKESENYHFFKRSSINS